jgi:ATP-binding cassette, subfamily C (CFTR/MRP), member 1
MWQSISSVGLSLAELRTHTEDSLDNVIGPQGLLSTKARVLVTNSIAFIKQFDQVAYLRRGIILETGTYDVLMAREDSRVFQLM